MENNVINAKLTRIKNECKQMIYEEELDRLRDQVALQQMIREVSDLLNRAIKVIKGGKDDLLQRY